MSGEQAVERKVRMAYGLIEDTQDNGAEGENAGK